MEFNVVKEPELYDIFNSKCTDDIPMYLSLFSDSKRVLELGIGTGRIAIPLVNCGISVIGIDNSSEMLQGLKEKINSGCCKYPKNLIVYKQDFCHLSIQENFEFAFFPFCTFNYLLTIAQQEQALISLKKYLNKSKVIFDLMSIHTFPDMLYNRHKIYHDTISVDNTSICIYTSSAFDQSTQLFTQERIFKYFRANDMIGEKHVKMVNRIFFLGEFEQLLTKCGYKILDIFGNYNLAPYNRSSPSLIVVASLI